MALINCPSCNKEISDKSLSCINCGYPINTISSYRNNNRTFEHNEFCKCGNKPPKWNILKDDKNYLRVFFAILAGIVGIICLLTIIISLTDGNETKVKGLGLIIGFFTLKYSITILFYNPYRKLICQYCGRKKEIKVKD